MGDGAKTRRDIGIEARRSLTSPDARAGEGMVTGVMGEEVGAVGSEVLGISNGVSSNE